MRAATWNLQHGRPLVGMTRNDLLAQSLAVLDVDILAAQEVDCGQIRSWFVNQVDLAVTATGSTASVYAKTETIIPGSAGNVLCVRGEILNSEILRYATQRKAGMRRVAILAVVRLETGEELSVAATHLEMDEVTQLAQLEELLDVFSNWPAPRLLLGDLNMDAATAKPLFKKAGLTMAPGGPSFPSRDPATRIDHVAVAGLKISSASVAWMPVSDHCAVVAELA